MPRCLTCKEKFEVKTFLQKNCFKYDECIKAELERKTDLAKKQRYKSWKKTEKSGKEKLKTNKDYLKELQVVFNKFIRTRDLHKGCISCGKSLLNSKYDAGHFYSVGSTPSLRFNEDNVHGQCVYCNQHLHANIHAYTERLPLRIGKESLELLKPLKNGVCKYDNTELKELKELYKQKIKDL
jgi:hypothetical protein